MAIAADVIRGYPSIGVTDSVTVFQLSSQKRLATVGGKLGAIVDDPAGQRATGVNGKHEFLTDRWATDRALRRSAGTRAPATALVDGGGDTGGVAVLRRFDIAAVHGDPDGLDRWGQRPPVCRLPKRDNGGGRWLYRQCAGQPMIRKVNERRRLRSALEQALASNGVDAMAGVDSAAPYALLLTVQTLAFDRARTGLVWSPPRPKQARVDRRPPGTVTLLIAP